MNTDQRQNELFPWEEPEGAVEQAERPERSEPAESIRTAPATAERDPLMAAAAAVPGSEILDSPERTRRDDAHGRTADEEEEQASSESASRERPIASREYYSISEVCDLVGLKPHVLRYWETQFQVLNPSKNRSGNRVYQRKEIRLILLVKHLLYEEKYTVEGARAKLDQIRRGGDLQEKTTRVLDAQLVDLLRADMAQLARILAPPERS